MRKAKPHAKYGYLQINTEIALGLTAEEVAKLWPAQKAFVGRVRRQAGLPDLIAGELVKASAAPANSTAPAEMLEEFGAWVAGREWRFAKSYWWAPHWYHNCPLDSPRPERLAFERMVLFIREHGVRERYDKTYYTKLECDGWKFWTMGWPPDRTFILNRTKVGALMLPRPPKPQMTLLTKKLKPSRRRV